MVGAGAHQHHKALFSDGLPISATACKHLGPARAPYTLQGDDVWYLEGTKDEFELPIGAKVKSSDAGQIVLTLATGEVSDVATCSKRDALPPDRRVR